MSRIRADQLVNRAGSGGPKFPHGVAEGFSVSGVVTATSYRGDGSQLTGIDASSLKDGSDIKIQATNTGATVTGTLVATVTGDVTGNVTGNLTGDSTGTHTGNVTGTATTATNLANAGNITTGTIADARFPSELPAISGINLTNVASQADINTLTANVAMLGFKVAVNGSLSKYSLVDQIIDEFVDASGIDSGASTNAVVNGTADGKYYSSMVAGNYYGDGSDGTFNSIGNATVTVQNKNGTYDGDMVIKQYTSFTLNAGHTFTPDQACRGMLIYVQGDCVINGTIDMTARGASADPTDTSSWGSAGSDGNTLGANGLQIGLIRTGGTQTYTNDGSGFNGCGTAARNAVINQNPISGNGKIYSVARQGAGGGVTPTGSNPTIGTNGSSATGATGGGGGGGISHSAYQQAGDGSYGSCWSGGSGGAGTHNGNINTTKDALPWGGRGGYGNSNGNAGGAGNPGGFGNGGHGGTGENGTGGLLIIICGGTLSGSGTLNAKGKNGGPFVNNTCGGGGGSGGGAIMALAGTYSFSGTTSVAGGSGTNTGNGGGSADGGAGGDGYFIGEGGLQNAVVNATGTLQSVDTTASSVPTKSDFVALIENSQGTAVLNTDIKAYVSRDSGTTFTQGTLVDEGTWGTNKKIVAFHDLDISSQPSGTAMCYKIEWANQSSGSKETRVHAVSHGWA